MTTKQISIGIDLDSTILARVVQAANKYKSQISFECGQRFANAKSIMGVMSLNLSAEKFITANADGIDEEAALSEMNKMFNSY